MNKQVMRRKKKNGFTLVEIMAVVALIAILFVIFVPRLDFANNKVRESGLQSDFRSYQLAFEQVARQNSGFNTFDADGNGTIEESEAKSLAKALNSYLDKKLQLQVEGTTFTLEIEDPWKELYTFTWDVATDSVYVFSAGANKKITGDTVAAKLNLDASGNYILEGEPNYSEDNADNYGLSVAYDVEGLTIKSYGFDNNIDR